MDWKKEIGIAFLVRERVAQLDVENLWPFHFPRIAASEIAIEATERHIGSLSSEYRAFLLHADGWEAFFHAVDLFGTEELVGGERMMRAVAIVRSLSPLEELCGVGEDEVVPIAASGDSIDVFLLGRPEGRKSGRVLWCAGQLIEEFASFSEFFLAMVDYCREDVRDFEAGE